MTNTNPTDTAAALAIAQGQHRYWSKMAKQDGRFGKFEREALIALYDAEAAHRSATAAA